MPRMKTHSGSKKRFKVTPRGKVSHEQANRRHLMEGKSSRRLRRLMADDILPAGDAKKALRLLGKR